MVVVMVHVSPCCNQCMGREDCCPNDGLPGDENNDAVSDDGTACAVITEWFSGSRTERFCSLQRILSAQPSSVIEKSTEIQ